MDLPAVAPSILLRQAGGNVINNGVFSCAWAEGRRMSNTSILTNSSFDPEAMETLDAALDDAWEAVQRCGGTLSRPAYAGAIREVLAKRIIEAAQRGQSDA